MSFCRLVCAMCWCLSALVSVRTVAQNSPKVDPVERRNPTSAAWSHKIISFSDEKVVLGLPEGYGRMIKHCSDDGTTFVVHDILVSGARYPLILRVQPTEISEQAGTEGESAILRQRLFEFHAFN
jgi:hypothetical protein